MKATTIENIKLSGYTLSYILNDEYKIYRVNKLKAFFVRIFGWKTKDKAIKLKGLFRMSLFMLKPTIVINLENKNESYCK